MREKYLNGSERREPRHPEKKMRPGIRKCAYWAKMLPANK